MKEKMELQEKNREREGYITSIENKYETLEYFINTVYENYIYEILIINNKFKFNTIINKEELLFNLAEHDNHLLNIWCKYKKMEQNDIKNDIYIVSNNKNKEIGILIDYGHFKSIKKLNLNEKNNFYIIEFNKNNKIICVQLKENEYKVKNIIPIGKFINNDVYKNKKNYDTFYIDIDNI
jgi:hypothetical protein